MTARYVNWRLSWFSGACCSFLSPSQVVCTQSRRTIVLYEKNKKGTDEDPPKESVGQKINYFVRNFVPETKKFVHEQKVVHSSGVMLEAGHGNYEVVFRFDDQASLSHWIVTADRDNAGGQSTASFVLSQNRTGLFRGNLCKEVPKDGKTKYAGYCNITSKTPMKSFRRETHWDWSLFNCLLMRVRGDGRPYNIVLGCDFYYDVNWLNRWCFPLFTRGGPYWQVAKIPFSKFYFSNHGRIQDTQEHIPLEIVNSFGITVADSAEGPYCLEIDSIAVMHDINLSGKHAYELYHDRNFQGQT